MNIYVHYNKPNDSYYAIIHRPEAKPELIELPGAKSWDQAEKMVRLNYPSATLG